MKSEFALVFALATLPVLASELVHPSQIEIFTDSDHPVSAQGQSNVHVYRLDAPSRVEKALSAGLPTDLDTAKQIAAQRVRRTASSRAGALAQAYRGLMLARRYGLDRLPAVVFDGGLAVVYGITDFEIAVSHYRRWRQIQDDPRP